MRKLSQEYLVFNWLYDGHTITPLEALRKFDSLRLGAIIYRLRKLHWNIETEMIRTRTGKRIARYRMIK